MLKRLQNAKIKQRTVGRPDVEKDENIIIKYTRMKLTACDKSYEKTKCIHKFSFNFDSSYLITSHQCLTPRISVTYNKFVYFGLFRHVVMKHFNITTKIYKNCINITINMI